jgi:hypothetical protein
MTPEQVNNARMAHSRFPTALCILQCVFGGRFLIAVLAAAIVIHLLHGWFDVRVLVVYAAATWAVVAEKSKATEQRT